MVMYAGIYRWVLVGVDGCLVISCQPLGLCLGDIRCKIKDGKKKRGKKKE